MHTFDGSDASFVEMERLYGAAFARGVRGTVGRMPAQAVPVGRLLPSPVSLSIVGGAAEAGVGKARLLHGV